MRRTLVLKKETVSELTTTELAGIAGGNTNICPSNGCVYSWYLTCKIRTLLDCAELRG